MIDFILNRIQNFVSRASSGFFKKADWMGAAVEYEKAAVLYRNAKCYKKAIHAYKKAAEAHTKNSLPGSAAK
jgi:hypothetical protein